MESNLGCKTATPNDDLTCNIRPSVFVVQRSFSGTESGTECLVKQRKMTQTVEVLASTAPASASRNM